MVVEEFLLESYDRRAVAALVWLRGPEITDEIQLYKLRADTPPESAGSVAMRSLAVNDENLCQAVLFCPFKEIFHFLQSDFGMKVVQVDVGKEFSYRKIG